MSVVEEKDVLSHVLVFVDKSSLVSCMLVSEHQAPTPPSNSVFLSGAWG